MAAPTILAFTSDARGNVAYAPFTASNKWSATLTTGSAASITVPSDYAKWCAVFSFQPGTDVWVSFDGTAATAPVGATFATTNSELNPSSRTVLEGSVISCITDNTSADVGIMLYALPLGS